MPAPSQGVSLTLVQGPADRLYDDHPMNEADPDGIRACLASGGCGAEHTAELGQREAVGAVPPSGHMPPAMPVADPDGFGADLNVRRRRISR